MKVMEHLGWGLADLISSQVVGGLDQQEQDSIVEVFIMGFKLARDMALELHDETGSQACSMKRTKLKRLGEGIVK